jgi:hypothetical protein
MIAQAADQYYPEGTLIQYGPPGTNMGGQNRGLHGANINITENNSGNFYGTGAGPNNTVIDSMGNTFSNGAGVNQVNVFGKNSGMTTYGG